MGRRALVGVVGLLGLLFGFVAWGAFVPDDPKVIPLGEPGTEWADLEPGVAGGTFHIASPSNPQ